MLRVEGSLRNGDERAAEADPDSRSEQRRGERVQPALGRERADEPTAAHAHRSRHPELRLPFGGEHDEQLNQQEEPRDHAEAAHGREHLGEALAGRVGLVEDDALDVDDLRV